MQYLIWGGVFNEQNEFLMEQILAIESTKMRDAIKEFLRLMAVRHPRCKVRIIEAKLQSSRRYEDINKYTDL
jgi:hypothetical protein